MGLKVLIVGGVAGGASAAARLRRLDENSEIIIFERGEYISYANCGLPYYIGEVITDKESLVVQTPEKMKDRFNIDVRTSNEVTRIFPDKNTVEVLNKKENKIYSESYDKLILSPGAEPVVPSLPGLESVDNIFTLRNIPDTFKIKEFVDRKKPRRALIVGAGFIGLELAENLFRRGVKVTVVELAEHVIGPLDLDMAVIVHQHMKFKNVEFYLKDGVKSFSKEDEATVAELKSGKKIKFDMGIISVGIKPESTIAKEAGLKIGGTGGILVDRYMQTSSKDIYAVGDAVEVTDRINENPALIPLAGPANRQGRIAANNIMGVKEEYLGTLGTSIVKVFDLTVATTGNNEKTLKKNKIEFYKSFTHSPSHAGYYPDSIPLSIKLLFSKRDGKILGAQIIGYEGVDKRIDVISTAIHKGMTVSDLEKLELAYAPPYSSAKDPVNIAGYVASNITKGDVVPFYWEDVAGLDSKKTILIDVRTKEEYDLGTIEGAVNIPIDDLRQRLGEIPADKDLYVFCQVGLRGYVASRMLMQNGYEKVFNLSGGYKTYQLAVQKQGNEDIYENDIITKDDEIKPIDCYGDDCEKEQEIEVNACGLQCPGPIMIVFETLKNVKEGDTIHVKATDPAFAEDIKAWCEKTGNKLIDLDFENRTFHARIRKHGLENEGKKVVGNSKTMVIFSNDLDRAIASFIIANGAASMGRKVTLFFTFWGLNVLRKRNVAGVKKDFISKMFGLMMPKGSGKLTLSKMNMFGLGGKMIRYIMKKKNVSSLEELIDNAMKNGVEFVACNMSMDIMGIKKEELIDGVSIGGVAAYLGSAEEANMNLFI